MPPFCDFHIFSFKKREQFLEMFILTSIVLTFFVLKRLVLGTLEISWNHLYSFCSFSWQVNIKRGEEGVEALRIKGEIGRLNGSIYQRLPKNPSYCNINISNGCKFLR